MFNHYGYNNISRCITETAHKLQLEEGNVIDILDTFDDYRGIKKYFHESKKEERVANNLNYLSGPSSFTFFKIHGKRVLLLGEYHTNTGLCSDDTMKKSGAYEIQDWIVELCKDNTDKCIDLFTETPKFGRFDSSQLNCNGKTKLKDFHDPLSSILCTLKISAPHIKNLRHHNIDLRKHNTLEFPGTHIYEIAASGKAGDKKKYMVTAANYQAHKVTLLSYLLTLDKSTYAQKTYHAHMKLMHDIYNEPFSIKDAELIESYYFASVEKELNKMDESIITNKQRFLYTLLSIYLQEDMFVGLMIVPMDLYFLARLFIVFGTSASGSSETKFDEHKMQRETNPLGCKNSNVIENAIVYTGAGHTRYYRQFFEQYFNTRPLVVGTSTDKSQCIKLNRFNYFQ